MRKSPSGCVMVDHEWRWWLLLAGFCSILLWPGWPPAIPAAPAPSEPLIAVTVLPLENRTGQQDLVFWTHAASEMIRSRIFAFPALNGSSRPLAIKAWAKTGLKPGDVIPLEQVQKLGQELDRQYVIWGHYEKEGSAWQITIRILTVATGETSRDFTVKSESWQDAAEGVVSRVVEHLKVPQTEAALRRMKKRITESPTALEWLAKALAAEESGQSADVVEELVGKALAADPKSSNIRVSLVSILLDQDKTAEAMRMTRQVLEDDPDFYQANLIMGQLEFHENGNLEAAEMCLKKAAQLEPTETEVLPYLGQVYLLRGQWDEAIGVFQQWVERDPRSAFGWANLAKAHKVAQHVPEAVRAVEQAIQVSEGTAQELEAIASVYVILGDLPKAKDYLERLRKLAESEEVEESILKALTGDVQLLEQRAQPTYLKAEMPRSYSATELKDALHAMMTPEEAAQWVNPIESSPAMAEWARSIVGTEANEEARARLLFDALDQRVQKPGLGGARRAVEIFEAWSDPDQSFSCQEFAKLYLVLGRAVGLKAYYVHLDKDFSGRPVYHDSAGVFLEQGLVLVDPAYHWFGVPHRQWVVLNDLQVLAHQVLQGSDVARSRMAVQLQPDLPWNHLAFAKRLLEAEQANEAEQAVERAQALEPGRWDIHQVRGWIALQRGDMITAEKELKMALDINPHDPQVHLLLGQLKMSATLFDEARDFFQAALRHAQQLGDPDLMAEVRAGLSRYQQFLALQKGDPTVMEHLLQRAEEGDPQAQNDLGATLSSQSDPDYVGALKWFRRSADQGNSIATLNLARMYYRGVGVPRDLAEAQRWFLKAAEQGNVEAMDQLAGMFLDGDGVPKDPDQGLVWATRAAERGFSHAQVQLGRYLYEGDILKKDYAQAYFWLSLAQRSGNKDAKALLQEMEIFLSPQELKEGRRRLEAFDAGHKVP